MHERHLPSFEVCEEPLFEGDLYVTEWEPPYEEDDDYDTVGFPEDDVE